MNDDKLKIAVFIDFDNIQIGVRSTMGRDFDLGLILEALKERGEVVTKIAYGNWKRAGELTRTLTQNAVLMVQRDLTPRGDKNGADINLALDALEMAINHPHINAFVVVGGDSDFIALVEKLKQYNKAVFVVGGRSFTSSVLQRNCREFIAYENLIEPAVSDRRRDGKEAADGVRRRELYPIENVVPLVYRALKVLSDRSVQAQLGLLKSTLVQLDSTFNERDFGASSFRQFVQKLADKELVTLRQHGNSCLVEPLDREPSLELPAPEPEQRTDAEPVEGELEPAPLTADGEESAENLPSPVIPVAAPAPAVLNGPALPQGEAVELLTKVLLPLRGTNPRPLYLRNVKQLLRNEAPGFDEQRYGFASLVELLRIGQNQNLLRLQRDRRGALRVFIPGGTPPPSANGPVAPAPSAPPVTTRAAEGLEADGQPESGAVPANAAVPPAEEGEDSQIALLGYYNGVHGEGAEEQPLSLADAVAAEAGGRKKRAPRKPKAKPEGAPKAPRKRKPSAK